MDEQTSSPNRLVIGWREWVVLPAFSDKSFRAKIDTGAKTSALHARRLSVEREGGRDIARFSMSHEGPRYKAEVVELRHVRSSNGRLEERPTIRTDLMIGRRRWSILITLTNRKHMKYRMLIGREALNSRVIIQPESSYLAKREFKT